MELVTDINVLKNINNEDLLKLISVLKELDYDINAYKIAISEVVLKYRSVDDQILLMRKICDTFRPNINLFIAYDFVALCDIGQQLIAIDTNSASKNILNFKSVLSIVSDEKELDELLGILAECDDTKEMKVSEEYFARKLRQRDLPF